MTAREKARNEFEKWLRMEDSIYESYDYQKLPFFNLITGIRATHRDEKEGWEHCTIPGYPGFDREAKQWIFYKISDTEVVYESGRMDIPDEFFVPALAYDMQLELVK